jgi:hypothetical protein
MLGSRPYLGDPAYWDSGDQSGGAEPQTLRTERLEGAQRERIWAITEAHESGLSVRQIASATGLSPSRDPREIPGGNCQRRRPNRPDEPRQEAAPSRGLPDLLTRWQSSSRYREWLERLDCGELVVVNLRPETDPETEYVAFDRPRVLRVLDRIIADLDELAGFPAIIDEERGKVGDAEARRDRHRRRLAEPDPPPKRLSVQEERAELRALLDLPPTERG